MVVLKPMLTTTYVGPLDNEWGFRRDQPLLGWVNSMGELELADYPGVIFPSYWFTDVRVDYL